ncbi:9560_t:CDS:2, partial [Scutellospora calospora]
MSMPPDINKILDIEEEDQEIDMEFDNDNLDNIIDSILDATDGVGHMWESVDDDNTVSSKSNNERVKIYSLPINEYITWIRDLEKGGLSYVRHDRKSNWYSAKKKNLWTERWYCHRYGTYKSIAGKNLNKKPRIVQKETKKCDCKSFICVTLPINSSNVVLYYYYKHTNHYPGHLSDLCTMPLSENIRTFIQTCALEGLDAFSIQRLLRFRAVEVKDQIRIDTKGYLQDARMLRDAFITCDDIYTIVYNIMKKLIYFDKNELISLEKWKEKLINTGGNCLFERDNEFEFLFVFQTKEQKNLIEFRRVLCLDRNRYPVTFLISKFKRSSMLNQWFNFLKGTNEKFSSDIFMVDDAEEEIKAVNESFLDSSVLLCHFYVLRSWRRRLGYKHDTNIDPNKTEGWNDAEAQQQVIKAINEWRSMGDKIIDDFANYFEFWWKPKYERRLERLLEDNDKKIEN